MIYVEICRDYEGLIFLILGLAIRSTPVHLSARCGHKSVQVPQLKITFVWDTLLECTATKVFQFLEARSEDNKCVGREEYFLAWTPAAGAIHSAAFSQALKEL